MASIKKRTRPGRQPDWRARVATPDGGEQVRCFPTKGEAEAWANGVEDDHRKGNYVDPARGKLTLAAWVELYLPTTLDLRASTRARDRSYISNHLLPHFGRWPLGRINRTAVQAWVNELAARRAPATAEKALTILSKIMDEAIRDGRLAVNPCRLVKRPRIEDEEARFLTPEELLALEDAMPEPWRDLVPFLADTGLRIGEAAALRWRDVDVARLTVTVRENLVEVPKAVSGSTSGVVVAAPKTTAGRRVVPMLTPETAERLKARRSGAGPSDYVFALPNGSPFRPNQFRARVWRPAVARAGLADPIRTAVHKVGETFRATVTNMVTSTMEIGKFPTRPEAEAWAASTGADWRLRAPAPAEVGPTPHALRHTAVAHWIAAGVTDQFKLKTWAGHRSIQTIDRIYGHLLPTDASDYRDAMSAMRAAAREAREQAEATPSNVVALDGRRR